MTSFVSSGKTPHALLLEGPAACGKRTLANLFAAALLCRGAGDAPCGTCAACHKVLTGIHPDVTVIGSPTDKSIGVDKIRQLRKDAYVKPTEADYRIFLVADAHLMTPQAQNALLKVLEEPPGSVVIVLTALSRSLLLPTVVSRTVCVPVEPLKTDHCLQVLQKRFPDKTRAELSAAAELSGGALGTALSMLIDKDFEENRAVIYRLCEAIGKKDSARFLLELGALEKNRELIRLFSKIYLSLLLGRARSGKTGLLAALSDEEIAHQTEVVIQLEEYFERNVNTSLILTWIHSAVTAGLSITRR